MVKEAEVPSPAQTSSRNRSKPDKPFMGNLALKCPKCKEMLVGRDWEKNLKVCPRCSFHFKLSAYERIEFLTDADSFVELDSDIVSVDPLKFVVRSQVYTSKLREESENVGLNEAVVIGHATTGGVTASFALLGDVILAEPGALICFAGPRVIEGFMHVKLPEGAVTSEFMLQHGMIDTVVHRRDLRQTLGRLLRFYAKVDVTGETRINQETR